MESIVEEEQDSILTACTLLKPCYWLGMVAHACNSQYLGAEVEGS